MISIFSTLSSGLASCAALVWTDVVHPMVGEISENKSTVILKVLGRYHVTSSFSSASSPSAFFLYFSFRTEEITFQQSG